MALRYAVRRDSGCHGCRCGPHTLLMQVRPARNGKRAVARPAHKRIAESSANRDLSAPGSATLPGGDLSRCKETLMQLRAVLPAGPDKCVNRGRIPRRNALGRSRTDDFSRCAALFRKFVLSLQCFHETLFRKTGVPGFDSRQSLIVSTPSAVWRLVNPDARFTNGNNSYALAA